MNKDVRTLADELDAIDELRKRGWKEWNCSACDETGHLRRAFLGRGVKCIHCDGKGYVWKGPITR